MRVAVCDPIDKNSMEKIKHLGYDILDYSQISKDELPGHLKDADILIVRSATKVKGDFFNHLKNTKLIIRGGVGLDNIDLVKSKELGIEVKNTPKASSISVAELVFAHIFALSRHIVRGTTGIKNSKWEKKQLKGVELYGKTIGIIGMGRIGREVAKRALALGMNVLGYDVMAFPGELAKKASLEEIFKQSDIITLHVPLIESTHHLINADTIKSLKDGVIIINCARGGIVDEEALYQGLKSGKIGGAGLDVYEKEPPVNSPLFEIGNVTLTPHIGASTSEAQARIGEEIVAILSEFKK